MQELQYSIDSKLNEYRCKIKRLEALEVEVTLEQSFGNQRAENKLHKKILYSPFSTARNSTRHNKSNRTHKVLRKVNRELKTLGEQ